MITPFAPQRNTLLPPDTTLVPTLPTIKRLLTPSNYCKKRTCAERHRFGRSACGPLFLAFRDR